MYALFVILLIFSVETPLATASELSGNNTIQSDAFKRDPKKLAEQFAPLVYFHPDEVYFPCSVPFFLEHSRLVRINTPEKGYGIGPFQPFVKAAKVTPLTKGTGVSVEDLSRYANKDTKESEADSKSVALDLMGNKEAYKGLPLENDKSPAPIYSKVVYENDNKAIIQYWFCYAYNGPFVLLTIAGRGPVGYHEGDWESIMVFAQKTENEWKPTSVYLSRHRRDRGEHIKLPSKVLQFEGTHPIIYAAKLGHASYPAPQRLPTSDGDLVGKGKVSWQTWKEVEIINDQTPWTQFLGRWGLSGMGPRGLIDKPLWVTHYPSDEAGNLTRKYDHTVLKEVEGISASKKPVFFNLDISTHHFNVCWVLYKKEGANKWVPAKTVNFDVMEKKRFSKDKQWHSIQNGLGCVTPGINALKNFYVRLKGNPEGEYKLAIWGKEP